MNCRKYNGRPIDRQRLHPRPNISTLEPGLNAVQAIDVRNSAGENHSHFQMLTQHGQKHNTQEKNNLFWDWSIRAENFAQPLLNSYG